MQTAAGTPLMPRLRLAAEVHGGCTVAHAEIAQVLHILSGQPCRELAHASLSYFERCRALPQKSDEGQVAGWCAGASSPAPPYALCSHVSDEPPVLSLLSTAFLQVEQPCDTGEFSGLEAHRTTVAQCG